MSKKRETPARKKVDMSEAVVILNLARFAGKSDDPSRVKAVEKIIQAVEGSEADED